MNYNLKLYLILALFTTFIACQNDKKEPSSETPVKTETSNDKKTAASPAPAPGSLSGDTINLSGKFVLFFGPEKSSGDEGIDFFMSNSAMVMDSLKKAGDLPCAYTSVNNFRIIDS